MSEEHLRKRLTTEKQKNARAERVQQRTDSKHKRELFRKNQEIERLKSQLATLEFEKRAVIYHSVSEKGALTRNLEQQINNMKLEFESQTAKWKAQLLTTKRKHDLQHAAFQALHQEIKKQAHDIAKITAKENNANVVTRKLISMVASKNLYNAENSTKEFLSRHVPTNLGNINTPLVFTDLDDPIIKAIIQVCSSGGGQNKFVTRLEELYRNGYHNSYQGPCKTSSLLMGDFVADFSSNCTNSISMTFRTVNTTHLKKKLNLFNHYGP